MGGSGIAGAVLAVLTQRVLSKRGLLTYTVVHSRVGVSADDAIFGSVKVTWNGNPVANLYTSTIELHNESLRDYDGVVIRVFTSDTSLLTERAEIVGTAQVLSWTPEFSSKLNVVPGQNATEAQLNLVYGGRDYIVPTMNRGQVIRMTFLNAAKGSNTPTIWLDILHKGAKLEFRVPPQQFMGVPQPAAVLVGMLVGIAVLALVARFINVIWVAGAISMIYGVLVVIPGAVLLRTWRRIRAAIGD
jgi:hypothetical protein